MAVGCQLHYYRRFSPPVSHDILGQREDECLETLGRGTGTYELLIRIWGCTVNEIHSLLSTERSAHPSISASLVANSRTNLRVW